MRTRALRALQLVGNAQYQWEQWTGTAYHIRRLVSVSERLRIGEAVDCRGTEEALRRFRAALPFLPPEAIRLAQAELLEVPR